MFENFNEKMLLERMKQSIDENIDTSEGTFTHDMLSPSANEMARIYSSMDYLLEQAFLVDAEGVYLSKKCLEFGVIRKEAQKAVGTVTFTGKLGAKIVLNTIISTSAGMQYVTTEEGVIDATGEIDIRIESIGYGLEYNVAAFAIKSINTSLTGVEKVTNKEEIKGSMVAESDESLKRRTLERVTYPSASGNAGHYKQWAFEVNGVGACKVVPVWNGPGTVRLVILDANKKTANEALIRNVADHVELNRPIGALVTVNTAKIRKISISVDIKQYGSDLLENVRKELEKRITKYLDASSFDKERVEYNKIVATLESLELEGIISGYRNVRLSGEGVGQDIVLDSDEIAVLEGVDINAYS